MSLAIIVNKYTSIKLCCSSKNHLKFKNYEVQAHGRRVSVAQPCVVDVDDTRLIIGCLLMPREQGKTQAHQTLTQGGNLFIHKRGSSIGTTHTFF